MSGSSYSLGLPRSCWSDARASAPDEWLGAKKSRSGSLGARSSGAGFDGLTAATSWGRQSEPEGGGAGEENGPGGRLGNIDGRIVGFVGIVRILRLVADAVLVLVDAGRFGDNPRTDDDRCRQNCGGTRRQDHRTRARVDSTNRVGWRHFKKGSFGSPSSFQGDRRIAGDPGRNRTGA